LFLSQHLSAPREAEDNHPFFEKNVYTFIHAKALFNPMLMSNVSIYLVNAAALPPVYSLTNKEKKKKQFIFPG
jgi:hypothetical protein